MLYGRKMTLLSEKKEVNEQGYQTITRKWKHADFRKQLTERIVYRAPLQLAIGKPEAYHSHTWSATIGTGSLAQLVRALRFNAKMSK